MEKRRPHHSLEDAIAQIKVIGIGAFTRTAIDGGRRMGLSGSALVKAACELGSSMFIKSMTTHQNNQIWQDVYHLPLESGIVAYVKITVIQNGKAVIQFKERDDG